MWCNGMITWSSQRRVASIQTALLAAASDLPRLKTATSQKLWCFIFSTQLVIMEKKIGKTKPKICPLPGSTCCCAAKPLHFAAQQNSTKYLNFQIWASHRCKYASQNSIFYFCSDQGNYAVFEFGTIGVRAIRLMKKITAIIHLQFFFFNNVFVLEKY